ncbi:hypothetical protein M885DRAFT_531975 [Pelagophyceae sp. CCMP2097]|nr:hypothetical protein M885DRAFT_531975 [Pelagophyceae sp. CCMP2097]|mmetsp:Transcript_29883/g.100674  ORF Transcript_29883/g.100674 Transcript_29883/m.100674 type:complete len:642 (+) Transcript_29883:188-2113(+)
MKCPNKECGSTDIDWQEAGGDAVCVRCGTVCEESTIVSTIEFSEGSGGASSVVGQFVSASCTKPYGGLGAPRSFGGGGGGRGGGQRPRYGFLRSSRETTLAVGKRKIQQVASSLRLGNVYVDGAHRLFGMAAQRNFTQGRKTMHVVCACLYVMCRREKSPHMLIDFSDVLQTSVYTLGSTFLKFRKLLNLELPIIDPSLYIHRFAAKLELEDRTTSVAATALRIVQRMRRDWIETGRRPAGVCAAALLVAARAHGFYRTQDDVVRALRVCGMTVSQRLADFQRTPAAQLSLADFHNNETFMGAAAEEHPPSFQRVQKQKDIDRATRLGEIAEGAREAIEKSWAHFEAGAGEGAEEGAVVPSSTALAVYEAPPVRAHKTSRRQLDRAVERDKLYDEIRQGLEEDTGISAFDERAVVCKPRLPVEANAYRHEGAAEDADAAGLDGEAEDEFEDVADCDIDGFILNDDEVRKKSAIWTSMNRDYLLAKEERDKLAAARAEAAAQDGGGDGKKKKRGKGGKREVATTARAALLDVVERRKFSKKINYKALQDIFGETPEAEKPPDKDGDVEETTKIPAPKRARTMVGGAPKAKVSAVAKGTAAAPPAKGKVTQETVVEDLQDDAEFAEDYDDGDYGDGDGDEEYD